MLSPGHGSGPITSPIRRCEGTDPSGGRRAPLMGVQPAGFEMTDRDALLFNPFFARVRLEFSMNRPDVVMNEFDLFGQLCGESNHRSPIPSTSLAFSNNVCIIGYRTAT